MASFLKLQVLLIFILFFSFSCKKENGNVFLRVIVPIDTLFTDIKILDAKENIPVDGNYYKANEHLEIKYTIKDVLVHEIKDWTSEMIQNQYDTASVYINEYLGEFERFNEDSYLTLTLSYTITKSDPIYVKPIITKWGDFGNYYFYSYDYYNNSTLTQSKQP